MPEVEHEPESQNAGPDRGTSDREKHRVREKSPAQAACDHATAVLGSQFCPECGDKLPAIPRGAIEQVVEQKLREVLPGLLAEAERKVESEPKEGEKKKKWYEETLPLVE